MENNNNITVKGTAKKAGLFAVDFVVAPVHIGLQLGSNILQATADAVAMGEGYITEKIDNKQDREEVANRRVAYTQQRFRETAMAAEMIKAKLQKSYDNASEKLHRLTHKTEELNATNNIEVAAEHVPEQGSNGSIIISQR